jgi:serine/threonine protein kinase/WD40 repeat protein
VSEPRPQAGRSWSPALARHIEGVCNRFEAAWKAGQRPALEEFVRGTVEPERSELLRELLGLVLAYCSQSDDRPNLEAYLLRFAQDVAVAPAGLREQVPPSPARPDPPNDRETLKAIRARGTVQDPKGTGPPLPTKAAEAEPPTVPPQPPAGKASVPGKVTVPGYEILAELGRGGMGVVYKARHTALKRLVALKMILAGGYAGAAEVARFRSEAEAVARLQHPGIVQIYEVGEVDGRPFFALEFVEGGSLAEQLDGTPLPARPAAHLVKQLAQAMHAAHQRGIVHRDLKPANVLLQGKAENPNPKSEARNPKSEHGGRTVSGLGFWLSAFSPKVTDFGLAKKLDEAGQTQSGAIMGTPSYMAPEQGGGKSGGIGPAADVYALGAILYELLSGRPPFKAPTPLDTVLQVLSDEPVAPAQLNPKVPRDLETICLKCLMKSPMRRYASAAALADDLGKFLAGEPIAARPTGRIERLRKWARRRPTVAALAGVSLAAAIALAAGGAWFTAELHSERDRAEDARIDADARAAAEKRAKDSAQQAKRRAETLLVDMQTSFGLNAAEQNNPVQAALWFANAVRLSGHDPDRERFNRVRFQNWTRGLTTPVRAMDHDGQLLKQILVHPGGQFLLTERADGVWTLWDVERERTTLLPGNTGRVTAAAWSPDGTRLALGTAAGRCRLFRFPALKPLQRIDQQGSVTALAFGGDGHVLAIASNQLQIWNCRDKQFLTDPVSHPGAVVRLVFNAAGDKVVTVCTDGRARVYALPTRPGKARLLFSPVANERIPYHPNGNFFTPVWIDRDCALLTYAGGDVLSWREAASGREIRTLQTGLWCVISVIPSPNGKYFVVGGWYGARLYDVGNGQPVGKMMTQPGICPSTAFLPDGHTLVTAGCNRIAAFWSVPHARALAKQPLFHSDEIWHIAWSAKGGYFLTGQKDGLICLWREGNPEVPGFRLFKPSGNSWAEAQAYCSEWLSRDHRSIVAACPPSGARVYSVATGVPLGPCLLPKGGYRRAAVLKNGPYVLTLGRHWLQGWDWRTGREVFQAVRTPSAAKEVVASPDGRFAVVTCVQQVLLVDARNGAIRRQLVHPGKAELVNYEPRALFSPDGRSFVTYNAWKDAVVWETATGRPRYPALGHKAVGMEIAFSPDGRYLVTASHDKTARVWDVVSGRAVAAPLRHPNWLFSACFSPHGRRLISACGDGAARLWDWRAGRLLCPPLQHKPKVWDATFSPDGRWLFTISEDRTGRIWDPLIGKPVTLPLPLSDIGYKVQVTADGNHVLLATIFGKDLYVVHLAGLLDPDLHHLDRQSVALLGEINARQRIHEGGGVGNLTSDEWRERWQKFRKAHPDVHRLASSPFALPGPAK